jgi:hypothetical protein
MKAWISAIFVAVLFTVSGTACRRGRELDSTKFVVETIEGVRHVHNRTPQAESSFPVTLELVGKIGELEGKEEKDILYDPVDAVRLPNGDILVLEGGGCVVKRYDSRHEYLSSFGHKGKGPGDFISPYRLRLSADKKRLCIADDRISWFSADGDYQGSFRPEHIGGSSIHQEYRTAGMAVLSGGRVILPSPPSLWMEPGEGGVLTIYDEAGAAIRSFGHVQRYDLPELTLNANVAHVSTDSRDRIYVTYAHQNRIDEYSQDGRIVFTADRSLPYPVKTETKMVLFKSGNLERELPWPSVTSVARGIAVDRRGRIWVLTYLTQPDKFGGFGNGAKPSACYEFDVFDGDGIWLFRVPFPETWVSGMSVVDDRIFLIDAENESCVREYRIVERD